MDGEVKRRFYFDRSETYRAMFSKERKKTPFPFGKGVFNSTYLWSTSFMCLMRSSTLLL